MHLAQLNVGRFRYPTDDSRMAGFMNNLELINGIAERSPGFVWRFTDDSGAAVNTRPAADPTLALNLTVWESSETLIQFVFKTLHKQFYARRDQWFEPMGEEKHFVMWWIEPGHIPTIDEAMERLRLLQIQGPSAEAFGWAEIMNGEAMRNERCAQAGGAA